MKFSQSAQQYSQNNTVTSQINQPNNKPAIQVKQPNRQTQKACKTKQHNAPQTTNLIAYTKKSNNGKHSTINNLNQNKFTKITKQPKTQITNHSQ